MHSATPTSHRMRGSRADTFIERLNGPNIMPGFVPFAGDGCSRSEHNQRPEWSSQRASGVQPWMARTTQEFQSKLSDSAMAELRAFLAEKSENDSKLDQIQTQDVAQYDPVKAGCDQGCPGLIAMKPLNSPPCTGVPGVKVQWGNRNRKLHSERYDQLRRYRSTLTGIL